jgi:gliding motility-associated-like protein
LAHSRVIIPEQSQMHTNKIREVMLKSVLSLFLIWIMIPNITVASEVDEIVIHTENLSSDCVAEGTISMGAGSAICENSPLTLTVTGHTQPIIGWMTSPNYGFTVGTTTLITTTQSTITITSGFSENTFVKVVFLSTDVALCPELFSAVFSVTVYSNINNNEITPSSNTYGCNTQGNIVISGPTPPSTAGSVFYVWQMSFDALNWNTVASGVNSVNLTIMQFPSQSVYFRRQINTTSCETSYSNTVFIDYIGFSDGGILTGGGEYCFSSNEVELSLSGQSGDILEWQSSLDGIDFNGIGGANQTTITFIDLQVTTYFRVMIQQSGCEIVYSNTVVATLTEEISNNVLSSSQFVCNNQIPTSIIGSTPTGGSNDGVFSVLWQKKEDGGDWMNIPVNQTPMQTYTFSEPLSITTYFRRIVSDSECDFSISNEVTIELVQNPSGYITAPETGCPGESTEITFHLTGYAPFTITFNDGSENYTLNNITQNEYSIWVNETADINYTLTAVSDNYCTSQNFTPSAVTVSYLPMVTTINAGMDAYICGLESTLIGSNPENDLLSNHWTDINGNILSSGSILETSVTNSGVYQYIYTILNESCSLSMSDTVWVTYDLPETSFAGENIQTCSNEVQMQATSLSTGQGYWIAPAGLGASNPFDPYATVFGLESGETYQLFWVAESQFGVCNADTSSVLIQVDTPAVAGYLSCGNPVVCEGTSVSIFAEGYTGTIQSWIISSSPDEMQVINDSAPSIESGALNASTGYQIIVQSGVCTPDTSSMYSIEVNLMTQAGILSENQSFCSTENEGVIEMTGFVGDILYWEFSNDNFETSEQIISGQTEYEFQNIELTTQIRTKLQSGICPEVLSNTVTIEIGELAELTFEIAPTFCSADNPIELNSLLTNGETGVWTANGSLVSYFNPSNYIGIDVELIVSAGIEPCTVTGSQTVHVFESPVASAGSDLEICGMEAILNATPSTGIGMWTANDEILFDSNANAANATVISLEYGTQTLIWTESNENCISSDEIQITFYQEPTPAFPGDDQHLDFSYYTTLNAENPEVGTAYWTAENQDIQFDNIHAANTTVRNLQIGENRLFWNVSNGICASQRSEIIVFVNPLVIPNGFTPNGDKVNDLYEIEGIENVAPVHLVVLNRWGEKVYENLDYRNQWDGRHKNGNDLQEDTYYYVINAAGLTKSLNGFIVLKR